MGREYGVTQKCAAEARRKTAWRENQALGGLVKTFRVPMVPGVVPPFNAKAPSIVPILIEESRAQFRKMKLKIVRAKREQRSENVKKRKRRKSKNKNED